MRNSGASPAEDAAADAAEALPAVEAAEDAALPPTAAAAAAAELPPPLSADAALLEDCSSARGARASAPASKPHTQQLISCMRARTTLHHLTESLPNGPECIAYLPRHMIRY